MPENGYFQLKHNDSLYYTVKLARANLPAMAAGNDCLRFPRVIGGNLPAPAGNLRGAFIDRVVGDFFKPWGLLLSSSKHLDQSNHLLFFKSMVNLSNLILFQRN